MKKKIVAMILVLACVTGIYAPENAWEAPVTVEASTQKGKKTPSIQKVYNAVKKAYGDDYIPSEKVSKKELKERYGISSKWYSAAIAEQEVTVKKPAKATVAAKNNAVKVTIKKVAGAAGYEVQYSTSKKFTKKTTKSKTTKKTSYTVKSLKDKTTYYVRVRAYKLDKNGKKVYSKWTSTTKVKTK